ncbi:hypothetical protein SAMN05421640_0569 [Ekhidna lutea]|uniref:Tellurite resistance protein TerB n=1 Tax=Ekhidna lutea TaxID=447679 RepID=A0A239FBX9_EKHLU|nr:hypothetical protein [Ekhidna lutea]SNS53672.1 hypothetical protein SAMN05421640_0569 [Ekhidna lutea]
MDSTTKKALLLLKSLIFHYHGLDEEEREMLEKTADSIQAKDEMEWANNFIAEDYLSAFKRSRQFLSKVFIRMNESDRVKYLMEVWEETHKKGYVTEMETTAILTLSKDWQVEKKFLERVKD